MVLKYHSQGHTILIDEEDKALFESYNWYLTPARQLTDKYYAFTKIEGKTVYLHRLIMGNPDGIVDHKNRNTLDCTRQNLRVTTQSINRLNCRVRQNKTSSQFKGVFKNKKGRTKPFYSMLQLKHKKIWLGSFDTEIEAAEAYNKKFAELFPEIAA